MGSVDVAALNAYGLECFDEYGEATCDPLYATLERKRLMRFAMDNSQDLSNITYVPDSDRVIEGREGVDRILQYIASKEIDPSEFVSPLVGAVAVEREIVVDPFVNRLLNNPTNDDLQALEDISQVFYNTWLAARPLEDQQYGENRREFPVDYFEIRQTCMRIVNDIETLRDQLTGRRSGNRIAAGASGVAAPPPPIAAAAAAAAAPPAAPLRRAPRASSSSAAAAAAAPSGGPTYSPAVPSNWPSIVSIASKERRERLIEEAGMKGYSPAGHCGMTNKDECEKDENCLWGPNKGCYAKKGRRQEGGAQLPSLREAREFIAQHPRLRNIELGN